MSEENMDDFERSLKRALKRVDAGAEMRAKFLAIAAEAEREHRQTGRLWVTPKSGGKLFFLPKFPVWATGAIAALLLVGVFSIEQVREKRERVVLADRDFAVSQQITEQALEHTREQLQRAGIALDGD
ncbi:MAG: hypothetical protein M3R43_11210 [Acidobacteriota bacterium]|nr:hypothetical protein [Acidobacteriota bacterium]